MLYRAHRLHCAGDLLAVALLTLASVASAADGPGIEALPFRGVHFNPQVNPGEQDFAWLCTYPEHRGAIRTALADLASTAKLNLIDVFVCIAYALKEPAKAPQEGQPLAQWANVAYLDNMVAFVDGNPEYHVL